MAIEVGDKFQSTDGSWHSTAAEAQKADFDSVHNKGGSGGGSGGGGKGGGIGGGGLAGAGMAGAFAAIFIFGPIIFAKLVGLVWGLLLKIPSIGKFNPGKILTTAIIALLFLPFGLANFGMVGGSGVVETIFAFLTNVITWSIVLLIPAVYFCWHYDTVKAMGVLEFSNKLKKGAMIWWFGLIGVIILLLIKSGGNVGSKAEAIVAGIVFISGLIYYFISTRPYARAVKEQNRGAKTAWKWLVVLVAFGLTVPLSISSVTAAKVKSAKIEGAYDKLEEIRANPSGHTFKISSYLTFTPTIYAEPSVTSAFVNTVKGADEVKATGNITKGVWLPVDVGSNKGYVFAPYFESANPAISGRLFSNYPYEATASAEIDYYAMDGIQKDYSREGVLASGATVKVGPPGGGTKLRGSDRYSNVNVSINGTQYEIQARDMVKLVPKEFYQSGQTQQTQDTQSQSESVQDTQSSIDETSVSAVSATPDPSIPQANQSASSDIDAREYRGRNNQEFQFLITGTSGGRVWGSGPYTDDSNIARAAVHAGKLKNGETGWITIRIMPGQSSYSGSTANGVETNEYGSFEGSFVFP